MSIIADLKRRFGVSNVVIPKEGPVTVPVVLDFSAENTAELEGLLITQSEAISAIQGVYIDNADNDDQLEILVKTTRQRIIAPPNSQGFYSLLTINPPDMTVTTTASAGLRITLHFYNVPIQSEQWSTVTAGAFAGLTNAQLRAAPVEIEGALTDAELRATPVDVAGPLTDAELRAFAVPVIPAIMPLTLAESIVTATGISQTLIPIGDGLNYFRIFNPVGNGPFTINFAGDDAAVSGEVLTAGNVIVFERGVINEITCAGTLGDDIIVYAD